MIVLSEFKFWLVICTVTSIGERDGGSSPLWWPN